MTILICQGHSATPSAGVMVCLLFAFPPLDADVSAGRSQTIHSCFVCFVSSMPRTCQTHTVYNIYLLIK